MFISGEKLIRRNRHYIHTYIHTLLLPPQWGFSGTITSITKLLTTIQSKLIKFKKHLQHYLNFVVAEMGRRSL